MTALWVPESSPPHISSEAEETVLGRVLAEGVPAIAAEGLEILRDEHEPLADYLDRLGFTLNGLSAEGIWPDRIVKTVASISIVAYRESGYFQEVDEDAFNTGATLAMATGIPETYAVSFLFDENLCSLIDTVREAPHLREGGFDSRHTGGYEQIASIAGGCVRHYLQQAIAA